MSSIPDILINKETIPLALYGLGTETERLLRGLPQSFNIVGLLDGFRTEGEIYGKKIISLDCAIDQGVKVIIVVARPGSCKAIAKRISSVCVQNHIQVFDVRGRDLLNDKRDIYSKHKVLELLKQTSKDLYSDELKIRLFEERFIYNQEEDNPSAVVQDAYDIGYLFCAPIITDFVLWFRECLKKSDIHNVFFFARDGYLIKQLFEIIEQNENTIYFYTSRMASIRAGVENLEDIKYVDSMKFSGTLSANLAERYGIQVDDIPPEASVLDYSKIILGKSKVAREGYKKYISDLKVDSGNIAAFDFVAKGTTQYFLKKLMNNEMIGYYFLQLEPEFMKNKNLNIVPFYSSEELNESAIFDNYYILETVLTSEEPSAVDFNIDGSMVFAKETRTEKNIECFKRAQRGIVDYFREYIHRLPKDSDRKINKGIDEVFLKLIHNVEIKDRDFMELIDEDPFFNRMTDITDVL